MKWTDVAILEMRTKTRSQRLSELTSSMVRAVVGAAASTTLIFGVYLTNQNLTTVQTTQWFIWIMSVIMLSSWMVLTTGKLWEASSDEENSKRLVMFGAGAGLGALQLAIGNFLHLDFDDLHSGNSYWPWVLEQWQFTSEGQPSYVHYAVFTGLLFGFCRWWLHATPARNSRYDLLAAMIFAMVAWFLPVAMAGGIRQVPGSLPRKRLPPSTSSVPKSPSIPLFDSQAPLIALTTIPWQPKIHSLNPPSV